MSNEIAAEEAISAKRIFEIVGMSNEIAAGEAISAKKLMKRKPNHGWDIVLVTFDRDRCYATIWLIDCERMRLHYRRSLKMTEGTGFALVDSKLYAFGCRITEEEKDLKWSEILNFYVCDLDNGFPNYDFKRAGRLKAPKGKPFVVPYNNKIYLIPTSPVRRHKVVPLSDDPKSIGCEVVHLYNDCASEIIPSPFDQERRFPCAQDHSVDGGMLYLRVEGHWQRGSSVRVYRLNMDLDDNNWYCFPEKHRVTCETLEEPDLRLKKVIRHDWTHLGTKDKVCCADFPDGKFRVALTTYGDGDPVPRGSRYLSSVDELPRGCSLGNRYDFVRTGWVAPVDCDLNLFGVCMFYWDCDRKSHSMLVHQFQLTEELDDGQTVSWGMYDDCYAALGRPAYLFTRYGSHSF